MKEWREGAQTLERSEREEKQKSRSAGRTKVQKGRANKTGRK